MTHNSSIHTVVQSLRDDLREQRERIRQMHQRGADGPKICTRLASLVDSIATQLFDAALGELDPETADRLRGQIAIVGLGSYGRRQCAPYSDVDLMILHEARRAEDLTPVTRPLIQGVFDVGLTLGQSVRTVSEAVQLARDDAVICTSLLEARLLIGNQTLFETFRGNFGKMVRRRCKSLCQAFFEARTTERNQYGETVYLLEPHVKRSRGGLRDLNLLGWINFAELGEADPDRLYLAGALSKFDHRRLLSARSFLLRLRNEMHFHAGSANDLLDRAEQLRIAEGFGYRGNGGMLPVEQMMRDYFRHTNHLWQLVLRREAALRAPSTVARVLDPVLGKSIEGDYRVGLRFVSATASGLVKLKQDLSEVLQFVELSASEKKLIEPSNWSALLLAAPGFSDEIATPVAEQFMQLLAQEHVGESLRVLHALGFLEKIIPPMRDARCLLQFNQYHKYTVDEHSLLAVRRAVEFAQREDALGQAYRDIKDKPTLHLALLLHDLGKGHEEDHSEVGARLAGEMVDRLGLKPQQRRNVVSLVQKHLVMSHLAFRRDTSDQQLVEHFASELGSLELLRMLFVLTCADLAAVGPGVLNDWKVEVLAGLFNQSALYLQPSAETSAESRLLALRGEITDLLTERERTDPWYLQQTATLPPSYLAGRNAQDVAQTMRNLRQLDNASTNAWAEYQPETKTVEFTAGVDQGIGRGVFSSMAGALSKNRLQIHSAATEPLADGLLLLRYVVTDPEHHEAPSKQRLKSVCQAMIDSVDAADPPQFQAIWGEQQAEASIKLSVQPNDIKIDNGVSQECTVLEIFTFDRLGLLYSLARKVHDLELVIRHAKIGTYLDQVVDVFYVTDRTGHKITDEARLNQVREELLAVIETS